MPDKQGILQEIYRELSEEIEYNAIQTKDFGAKSDGFIMGYLIERLNNVLIKHLWSWDVEILPIQADEGIPRTFILSESTYMSNGTEVTKKTVAVRVKVYIRDELGNIVWAKESFGGCQMINNSLGDTLKGAQTDAMKKAFSYLGLGNTAYKGLISDIQRTFSYMREETENTLEELLNSYFPDKIITSDHKLLYINKFLKKKYMKLDDILHQDWKKLASHLNVKLEELENEQDKNIKEPTPKKTAKKKTSKKVKDETKDTDGENKVLPPEKEVDIPNREDDEPPF